jgi:uncharacterized protein
MSNTSEARPRRSLGPLDEEFWRACEENELRFPRCGQCEKLQWPPSSRCDACGGSELSWDRSTGSGVVRSFCVFERQYFAECPPPWPVVLVELDDGPLFLSNIVDCDVDALDDGTPVTVAFIDCHDDAGAFRLPVFRTAGAGQ